MQFGDKLHALLQRSVRDDEVAGLVGRLGLAHGEWDVNVDGACAVAVWRIVWCSLSCPPPPPPPPIGASRPCACLLCFT